MRFQNQPFYAGDASTPEAFREHWSAFVKRDKTLGSGSGIREQWHEGRTTYAVWAFRVKTSAVQERVQDIQQSLRSLVSPILIPQLHITVWVAGFPCKTVRRDDDVTFAVLDHQRQSLLSSCLFAPRLRVAGACAFFSCAILEVHDPHHDLARLRAHLSQSLDEVRFSRFNAHITIGLFDIAQPTSKLVKVLQLYRDIDSIDITPQTLELVFFNALIPRAPLETQATVTLPLEVA